MYFLIALVIFTVGSFAAFMLYGADKKRAKGGAWRISEKVLLLTGFLCGAPGALLAMRAFRHKTKHIYFYLINLTGLVWQITVLVYLFLMA